ncbi:MAG TPA: hypothetical protein VKP30_09380 [Polyangiaceae bacterium]|nr:hypothetical protein [Polyangiaceae bacterium]
MFEALSLAQRTAERGAAAIDELLPGQCRLYAYTPIRLYALRLYAYTPTQGHVPYSASVRN